MDSGIVIRKGREDDVEAMTLLLEELFAIEDDFTINRERQIRGLRLLLENSEADLRVAEYQNRVIGMVSMQRLVSTAMGAPVGLIEDLVITKQYRGKGIGRKLLSTIIDEVQHRGYARIALGVDLRNDSAVAFYRRFGFESSNMGLMYRIAV